MQMECTETRLSYLMSVVPEKDIASYFPVTKNHVLSNIMMGILKGNSGVKMKVFCMIGLHFLRQYLIIVSVDPWFEPRYFT